MTEPSPIHRLQYKWEVLIVVMIGTLMAALDQSIVNVSLPQIMADLGSTVEDIEWVITGYMLAFATLMPLTAWLREHIGYKQLFLASLGGFYTGLPSMRPGLEPAVPGDSQGHYRPWVAGPSPPPVWP